MPLGRKKNSKGFKLFLFVDDMILYIREPKDTTKRLLELISLVKLQDITSTESIHFAYTDNTMAAMA